MPYPLNLLPHDSSNNTGHLELKNLSVDLFYFIYQLKFLEFENLADFDALVVLFIAIKWQEIIFFFEKP